MNPAAGINELIHSHLTDIGCALIILIYAWDRFNTPPSNRSSTRRVLFWQACIGYLAATLALFTILTVLLGQQGWADLFDLQQKLPAPLLATMFDFFYQPGKLPASLADYLRGFIQERWIIRPKSP